MTEKRCTDCKHTKGIGYDFWCGEGHTEYEVFGAETNCPYYEYHDWSKGIPSKTEKRFVYYEHKGADYILENPNTDLDFIEMLGDCLEEKEIVNRLNELYEENEQLKQAYNDAKGDAEKKEQILKDILKDNLLIQDIEKELKE